MEFRRCLYALWPTKKCTLNVDAAAKELGVSPTTVRRWLNKKQRVPRSVWRLTWLLSSGQLPGFHGWTGWLFTRRWDESRGQYGHWLAAHNGTEYTAGDILSWHFQAQRLQALVLELQKHRKRPSPGIRVYRFNVRQLPGIDELQRLFSQSGAA